MLSVYTNPGGTELLRSRTEMDYSEYREKVLAKKQELFEMIDSVD